VVEHPSGSPPTSPRSPTRHTPARLPTGSRPGRSGAGQARPAPCLTGPPRPPDRHPDRPAGPPVRAGRTGHPTGLGQAGRTGADTPADRGRTAPPGQGAGQGSRRTQRPDPMRAGALPRPPAGALRPRLGGEARCGTAVAPVRATPGPPHQTEQRPRAPWMPASPVGDRQAPGTPRGEEPCPWSWFTSPTGRPLDGTTQSPDRSSDSADSLTSASDRTVTRADAPARQAAGPGGAGPPHPPPPPAPPRSASGRRSVSSSPTRGRAAPGSPAG
jgi:hypothetical protein